MRYFIFVFSLLLINCNDWRFTGFNSPNTPHAVQTPDDKYCTQDDQCGGNGAFCYKTTSYVGICSVVEPSK